MVIHADTEAGHLLITRRTGDTIYTWTLWTIWPNGRCIDGGSVDGDDIVVDTVSKAISKA